MSIGGAARLWPWLAAALLSCACSHGRDGGGSTTLPGAHEAAARLPDSSAVSASSGVPAAAAVASSATGAAAVNAPSSASAAGATGSAPPPSWLGAPVFRSSEPVDVVIAGGEVIDGTGASPTQADVVIDDGHIAHIGRVDAAVKAKRRVDARGLVVTPGFVDVHAHAAPVSANENLLAMGVTTAVVGQDGRSPKQGRLRHWLAKVQHTALSVNLAAMAGHATLRGLAHVGEKPSDKQIARLSRMVAQELDAGAFGLSTGLEYQPGAQATRAELIAIAKPVAERGSIIMSHLRSEDEDRIDDSLDELIAQGKQGARVHVAHIKVVYGKGVARAEALLAKMAAARKSGIELTADIYPYNASYTTISIIFPPFAKPPKSFKHARAKRRDELADFLRRKVARRGGPEATLFGSSPYAGKTLAQLAKEKGKPFEDVLIDDIGPGGASAAYFVMDDALQERLLADRWVMVGTDGGAHSSHPRGHGTFARIMAEYVRTRKTLSLTEAVRKMSGLAARTMRFDALKRGTLRPGNWADVLVFDPAKVQDHATYARPHRQSTGMRWVFVNGVAAIDNGRFTHARSGRLLRPAPTSNSNEKK